MATKWLNCHAAKVGLAAAVVLACGLFLTGWTDSGRRNHVDLMVFAPHEDDEAFCCSGVIRNAVLRGETVKLVMVTNGDFNGGENKARERLTQTISAMRMLGLTKSDILYFGYADRTVLGDAYQDSTHTAIFTSTDGKTQQTYGFPEMDMTDYHYTVFHSHGNYNREDLFKDFYAVLERYRPRHIYMPSPLERHPDHSVTGLLTIEALLQLRKVIGYTPTIHEYMLYYRWVPQTRSPDDPTAFINNTEDQTPEINPYAWDLRESVAVPSEMRLPFPPTSILNLKYNVLRAYGENTSDPLDNRFIRADEVFWERDMANIAFSATVTASSQNADTKQYAANVVDGVIMGSPLRNDAFELYDKEWATLGQRGGAWIRLTWPTPQAISRVVLYDRPNTNDHIQRATLTFSDGSSVPIAALPNNGSAREVYFPARTVSWVKLTVDEVDVSSINIGLSEFEVF
jgi:LmbE family N-acetylglucosaminyl deacetylase